MSEDAPDRDERKGEARGRERSRSIQPGCTRSALIREAVQRVCQRGRAARVADRGGVQGGHREAGGAAMTGVSAMTGVNAMTGT